MPTKPLDDKDRKSIRAGMAVWRAAQLRAGASEGAFVEFDEDERVPLGDLDGLTEAYIKALPDLDEDQTATEWHKDAGVQMMIVHDDKKSTAVVTFDVAASNVLDADFRLTGEGLELRIDDGSWGEADNQKKAWLSPLSSAFVSRGNNDTSEIVSLAGLAAAVRVTACVVWLVEASPSDLIRVQALVGLPCLLDQDSGDYIDISNSAFSCHTPEWVGVTHLIKMARPSEDVEEFAQRLSAGGGRFVEIVRGLTACSGDWALLASLGQMKPALKGVEFVVGGFIPAGVVALAAGAAGTGKSTLFHDLAVIVATPRLERDPDQHWLGVSSKDIQDGTAVFLSGEDSEPIVTARRQQLKSGLKPRGLIELCARGGASLTDLLDRLRRLDGLKLLVVDAARAFLDGSEDESAPADAFMAPLVQFAGETGCAVVVVHHLRKGISPISPAGVLEAIRGSQVFVDRPRAIIGLTSRRGVMSAAVIKSNIPTAFTMNTEIRSFRKNVETLRLDLMAERPEKVDRVATVVNEEVEAVVAAITRAHAEGRAVVKNGKRGAHKLPGLETMSRNTVHRAVDAAVAGDRLQVLPNRHIVPSGSAFPRLPPAEIGPSGTGAANAAG